MLDWVSLEGIVILRSAATHSTSKDGYLPLLAILIRFSPLHKPLVRT